MKNNKMRMRIAQLFCLCILSLLLITSCAKERKNSDRAETSKQEEQSDGQDESQESIESQQAVVLETMPTGLEELRFIDFGLNNIEYTKGTYKGEYGGTTLDDTLISAKVTFTTKGDTHILIGGKAAGGGFGINAIVPDKSEEWTLRLYDTNKDKKGWKFEPIYFYSDVAGVPLVGQEIDLKVSIQYVDNDGDGVENDVKVGMWFNDKLYNNEYIYLKDYATLGYSMGTWMTVIIFEGGQLFIN